jgi:hypothetical protein
MVARHAIGQAMAISVRGIGHDIPSLVNLQGTRGGEHRGLQSPIAVFTGADCRMVQAGIRGRLGLPGVTRDHHRSLHIQARGALKKELWAHLRRTRAMRLSRGMFKLGGYSVKI